MIKEFKENNTKEFRMLNLLFVDLLENVYDLKTYRTMFIKP